MNLCAYLRSVLRRAWMRSPERAKALKNAYSHKAVNPDTGRLINYYTCANCGIAHPARDMAVDHIISVGQLLSLDDLPDFTKKLFCDAEGLQLLCKRCHNEKTNRERSNTSRLRKPKGNTRVPKPAKGL